MLLEYNFNNGNYKGAVIKLRNKEPQFSKQNEGEKSPKVYLKRMFHLAKIGVTGRNIWNHSRKVTVCSELFNQCFDDLLVSGRSGYCSRCIDRYKRPTENTLKSVSQALQPSSSSTNDIIYYIKCSIVFIMSFYLKQFVLLSFSFYSHRN